MSLKQRGHAMRTFDCSFLSFHRRVRPAVSMLDKVGGAEGAAVPAILLNIKRAGENAYNISVAVAGFAE